MDKLSLIGGILLIVGLLIFSIRLMAYNRRNYDMDDSLEENSRNYITPNLVIRILAIIIFLVAMLIFAFGS